MPRFIAARGGIEDDANRHRPMILGPRALVEEFREKAELRSNEFSHLAVKHGKPCRIAIGGNWNIGKIMPMKDLTMPIGKARSDLCRVVKKVQSGVRITLTSHGRPQAVNHAGGRQVEALVRGKA